VLASATMWHKAMSGNYVRDCTPFISAVSKSLLSSADTVQFSDAATPTSKLAHTFVEGLTAILSEGGPVATRSSAKELLRQIRNLAEVPGLQAKLNWKALFHAHKCVRLRMLTEQSVGILRTALREKRQRQAVPAPWSDERDRQLGDRLTLLTRSFFVDLAEKQREEIQLLKGTLRLTVQAMFGRVIDLLRGQQELCAVTGIDPDALEHAGPTSMDMLIVASREIAQYTQMTAPPLQMYIPSCKAARLRALQAGTTKLHSALPSLQSRVATSDQLLHPNTNPWLRPPS